MTEPKKRGRPAKPKTANTLEQVAVEVANKSTPYRDERGLRVQTYRRFKEEIDYIPIEPNEMEAMIGLVNNKAKRNGRPPIFEDIEELQGAIQAFWDYLSEANKAGNCLIPDVEGLCCYLDIARDTLNDWERTNYKGFSATIKSTKNSIAFCKKQLALRGKIPPIVFATDFNNNHGYTQKQEIEVRATNPLGDTPNESELRRRIQGGTTQDAEVVDEQ